MTKPAPDPDGPRVLNLVSMLAERTRQGKLDWTVGSRSDSFIWSGANVSVTLQTRDRDGTAPFEIVLMDGSGRIALEWTTEPENGDPVEAEIEKVIRPLYYNLTERMGVKAQVFEALERELRDE